jgi:Chromosome segregation ATPases
MEKLVLNSPIQVSGLDDDKPYIELTTRLCWFNYPNLNGVGLLSDSKPSYETLIDMPVVAKLHSSGKKFGSHEIAIDDNGQYVFNTNAYGVHTEVYVEDDTVDIPNVGEVTVPCLFAKSKIWKRFASVVNLIANKMTNPDEYNGGLWSSWELQGKKYVLDENGNRMYSEYQFLSNCLIDVPPAYGTASKTLLVASEDIETSEFEQELENAYIKDSETLIATQNDDKGDENLSKENKNTETSELTSYDLYQKIRNALNANGWDSVPYYSIFEVYPVINKAIAYTYERESEDDYVIVEYKVENNEVTIDSLQNKKLSDLFSEFDVLNFKDRLQEKTQEFSEQLTAKDTEISELIKTIEANNVKIAEYEDKILKAGESILQYESQIETLESQVSELETVKEQLSQYQQVALEQEKAEKLASLKQVALSSKQFTDEEINSDERLQEIFSELDETALKVYIAERLINSSVETKEDNTEASEQKKPKEAEPIISASNLDVDRNKFGEAWLASMTTFRYKSKK